MLLMMLERNEPIHSAVFFDTGWEFPEMIEHIDKLEKYTGVEVVSLKHKEAFDYILSEKPIKAKSGELKGKIYRNGHGWPSAMRRWCTRWKVTAISKYQKQQKDFASCIGFAADEAKRVPVKQNKKWQERYPLIEWDVSEKEALQYCYDHGFDWGGLYDLFGRVSCFCCPLQRVGELKNLRKHRPELWRRMLEMDEAIKPNRGFKGYKTVEDFDRRFSAEESQIDLWPELAIA
jgi:3'-phosphoadenosine 5'-phosphosulfate sulfotransferase (PAPS reductase)/FAD synthetase